MEVSKKVKRTIVVLTGLTIFTLLTILLVHSYNTYAETTSRLSEILDLGNLKNYFENYLQNKASVYEDAVSEITDAAEVVIVKITNARPIEEIIIDLLSNTIIFILNLLNYFCNIGINIIMLLMIYYHETFNATNLKIRYTKGAIVFIKIQKFISFIINKIKNFLKRILLLLKRHRRKIALLCLLLLISNGLLYKILAEVLIFFITYIYHAFKLETYVILSSLGQSLFLMLYPIFKNIPYQLLIILLLYIILLRAFQKANYRLSKNHERLKNFSKDTLTQTTFINGAPGVGKTLLNVSLSLASEEVYIETLQDLMTDYELKYPDINFAKVRNNPDDYPEHKEYIEFYEYLNNRGSLLISNYSIYSPYYKAYSKIFDFDFMRKNLKANNYPLEEYIIISLSELDKEYNSHDDMKAVGEDGAATFFSTTSHDLKRHVKIFCDYQLKDQVPLRIRGNSEYFLTVRKRKKKYPVLLYLYYLPFLGLAKLTGKLISKYELKKSLISRKTKRKKVPEYKRNDYNLTYAILRNLGCK